MPGPGHVNAESSLRDEPGCERFDVLVPTGSADRVTLYEIYHDRAAFEAHCRTPHFAVFDAAVRGLVKDKQVSELELVAPKVQSARPVSSVVR